MNTPRPNTTIIHGTHRPQDLIPTLLDAVREYNPSAYAGLMVSPFGAIPAYVQDEGDDSPWWDGDDASYLLNEVLFDLLNEVSPEGCYFGAHPGDGSDFGWWETDHEP